MFFERGSMKKQITVAMVAMLVFGTLSLHAQSSTATPATTTAKKKAKPVRETAEQRAIRELQEKMAAQQAEIDELKQENAAKDAALSAAQSTAASAQSAAASATSQAAAAASQAQSADAATQSQADAVTGLKSTVSDLQTANANLVTTINTTKSDLNDSINSPAVLHYKGVTIMPVAFFAAEGVWRQHSVNSDINTPFNNIPLGSAPEGHVSELNFSGRQSRLGVLVSGGESLKLAGYFEGDFLGTGTSSNNNQSNSYVFRQRQFWGQVATASGFTMTGGQMWSLVTEDGTGTNNRTEKLPNTIDAQYMVGFNWTRQPGFRLQQRFGDPKTGAFTLAMSLEQAQITNFTVASSVTAAIPTQYFFGGLGQNGGLYNAAATNGGTSDITAYANNTAPDVVIKGAYDLPHAHFELGGLARFLRNEYFTSTEGGTASAPVYTYGTTYLTHIASAGGVFGSIRVSPSPFVDLAVQAMAGTGVGRYGSAQLADATLRPDGTLEPIRNYHGLLSIETHPTKKLDIFAYYGGEYAQRTIYTTALGNTIGYGPNNLNVSGCYNLPAGPSSSVGNTGFGGTLSATSCSAPTRYIQEPMVGFIYRVVSSPKFGRLQYWATYNYMQRNLWSGNNVSGSNPVTGPTGPRAADPMVFVSMRYYMP
jgi:uncharacterized small protein (DUF1192 family)